MMKPLAWIAVLEICMICLVGEACANSASTQPAHWSATALEPPISLVRQRTFTASGGEPSQNLAFSSDGRMLAEGCTEGVARVWDVKTGREIAQFSSGRLKHSPEELYEACGSSVEFSHDGRWLLTGSTTLWHLSPKYHYRMDTANNDAHLWDIKTGREIKTFSGHTDFVNTAHFSPDDKEIVTASEDGTVRLWDVKTGKQLRKIRFPESKATTKAVPKFHCAIFSPDGQYVAAGGEGGLIVWKVATGKVIWNTESGYPTGPIFWKLAFSSDGEQLATTAGSVGGVAVWTKEPFGGESSGCCIPSGQRIFHLRNSLWDPLAILFLPHSNNLLTVGIQKVRIGIRKLGESSKLKNQGVIRLINCWTGEEADLVHLDMIPMDMALSPNGRHLATVDVIPKGGSWKLQLWRVESTKGN